MFILQAGELRQATPDEISEMEASFAAANEAMADTKLQNVRLQRNAFLASTDWTVLPDSPLSAEKKAEYEVYRQALRDLMNGLENADDVVFPDKPE